MKQKFTTTLSIGHKKKLAVLAANDSLDKNEWIEKIIDIEWRKLINDMAIKNNKSTNA